MNARLNVSLHENSNCLSPIVSPDADPSNVPNFQNVDKACQYCYPIFIIKENSFFSWTRNKTIDFVWTWGFSTDKNFWNNKSKKRIFDSKLGFFWIGKFSTRKIWLDFFGQNRKGDSIQSGLYAFSGIRLKFNVFKFNI